eukprot:CAMPEP_0113520682 /NCGR_PEP_ID=MMETSP0014_2-20120614/44232_1 /TAXON_ID=2857 /ORGANISM="Nitzschia sp." /LENGTH=988 /DNA_ID=CAMNT_0000418581 /DNA_START=335 /DNA_END=3301 /DNA_ORIENTATION=+ /assembly_acc=CAM_ASM_000159
MRQLITPTNAASGNSTTPPPSSSKTQAEVRAAELEALRQRSLAKGQAARLQDAEAPTSDMMLNFQEAQRQKAKMEKEKLRDAKAYLNHYRGDDHAVLKERETRRSEVERERQKVQEAKEWLQHKTYAPTSSSQPNTPSSATKDKTKDVRSTFFHSDHVHGKEFTQDKSGNAGEGSTNVKQRINFLSAADQHLSSPNPIKDDRKLSSSPSNDIKKKDGVSTPSTVNTSLDSTSITNSIDDLDLFGDELAKIRSALDSMEYSRPKSLSVMLSELEGGIIDVNKLDDVNDKTHDEGTSSVGNGWVIVENTNVVEELTEQSPPMAEKEPKQAILDTTKATESEIVPESQQAAIDSKEEDIPKESEKISTEEKLIEVSSTVAVTERTPTLTPTEDFQNPSSSNVVEDDVDMEKVDSVQSKLIVLISSSTVVTQQRTHQDRAQTILTGKKLWTSNDESSNEYVEIVDGSDQTQKDKRSLLFGISGLRGKYPQFFLQESDSDDSITFLGDYDWLEDQNEMGLLSKHAILGTRKEQTSPRRAKKQGGGGQTKGTNLSIKPPIMLSISLILILCNVVQAADYTVQDSASWAISSDKLSTILGEDKQTLYDDYMDGCNEAVNRTADTDFCRNNDRHRIHMNVEQPSSVYNYTNKGYEKIRAPEELFSVIKQFWEANRDKAEVEWKDINVYHNTWEAPPTIVHLNQERTGGSTALQNKIWKLVQPILQEWTGHYLEGVSLYGIRLYHNNSILAPHVDRMPLVTSAIIQVDQDVDEPWPLEVYGHDGVATNVTMEPGDMVLYESHSVVHGRPFPMRGNFYANCFVHFEPIAPIDGSSKYDPTLDLPPYLIPGSAWETEWRKANKGWKKSSQEDAVKFARQGNLDGLKKMGRYMPEVFHNKDPNGWTVLHESARAGHLDLVQFLIEEQAIDKDLVTKTGVSPLSIARQFQGRDHLVTRFLESIDAEDIHPHKKRRTTTSDRKNPPASMPSSVKKRLYGDEL